MKRTTMDWMHTFTDGAFWPTAPRTQDVNVEDIAAALSNICRFGGHTHVDGRSVFYSVAQHSLLVSQYCPPEDQLWGLLHDGGEAYVGDTTRPFKMTEPFRKAFMEVEDAILERIAAKFELEWPLAPETIHQVKAADDWLLAAEARDLMGDPEWAHTVRGLVVPPLVPVPTIVPMDHQTARYEFLLRFYQLTGERS